MKFLKPILFLVWISVFSPVTHAGPSWQLVNPFLQNDGINSIIHSGTTFVAVGARGLVFSSPDGLIWTQQTSITTSNLNAVTWSPVYQQFVAVGDNGTIIFSPDGAQWKAIPVINGVVFNDIYWNSDLSEYLLVGTGGTILGLKAAFVDATKPQFKIKISTVTSGLNAIAWDSTHQRYLIAGDFGTILTSPNGVTWTSEKDGIGVIAAKFTDIAYNNISNKYFVTAENRGLFTSTADPTDTTGYQKWGATGGLGAFPVDLIINSIAIEPTTGLIVLMASPTGGRATIITSNSLGKVWTQRASNIAEQLNDIFWDVPTKQFIASGQNSRILTSPDGITWTIGTSWVNAVIKQTIYDAGPDPVNLPNKSLYINVGTKETILTSIDSIDWTVRQTNLTASFESVTVNPTATTAQPRYVIVGSGGAILSSSDGITWVTQSSSAITTDLYSVIWNPSDGKYIAVGSAGTVISSSDAINWTSENAGIPSTTHLRAIVWDSVKAQYVAVGLAGDIFVGKRDAAAVLQWMAETSNTTEDLLAVAWDNTNGQYVAVGLNGVVVVGTFDINSVLSWSLATSGVSSALNSVIWNADRARYLIVGDAGTVLTSTDGATTWTGQANINGRNLSTVIWDVDRVQYLAAGELGTILRRDIEPPVITLFGNNPAEIKQGVTFNDPGSSVSDNIDVGLVTTKKVFNGLGKLIGTDLGVVLPGAYRVEYDVTDASGNAAVTISRSVTVVDLTPPVIELLDDRRPYPTPLNLPFLNPGTKVTDNVDTNLVATESGLNQLIVTKVGVYSLTYDVSDSAGNAAKTVVRTVKVIDDTTPPVINVVGKSILSRKLGTRYTDLGALAVDDVDGDITADLVIDNPLLNINTTDEVAKETLLTIGTFTVTYTARDRSGNVATATRTVTVDPILKDQSGGRLDFVILCMLLFFLYQRKHAFLIKRLFK